MIRAPLGRVMLVRWMCTRTIEASLACVCAWCVQGGDGYPLQRERRGRGRRRPIARERGWGCTG